VAENMEEIQSVLKRHLPQGEKITGVSTISDGYSNRTLLLEGLNLILRLPPEGEPLLAAFGVHDVSGQYRIMEAFVDTAGAPPVPRPVLLETDAALLGFPFFLMERVDADVWGDFSRPEWLNQANSVFRSGVSQTLVQTYTDLHGLKPIASLGPVRSSSEELIRWRDPIEAIVSPTLKEVFSLLLDNAPTDQKPVPCHGDAKVANLLWKEGRVIAMIDMEMSFNGDPRWDVAALLQGLRSHDGQQPLPNEDENGFWGRDHILAQWQTITGRSIERLDWFQAADRARYASLLIHGQHLFDQGKATDQRFGSLGAFATRLGETALTFARRDSDN